MISLKRYISGMPVKDVFYLTTSKFSGAFFGFLSTIVLTRVLTTEGYGKYSYVFSLIGFFMFLSLPGMATSIMQAAANDHDKVLQVGTRSRIEFSFLASFCLIVFALFLRFRLSSELFAAVLIAALLFPFYACLSSYLSFINGKKLFSVYMRYSLIEDAFVFVATVLAALLTGSFLCIIIVILFSRIAIDMVLYLRSVRLFKKTDSDDPDALRLGRHYSVIAVMGSIENYLSKILIGTFISFAYLAIFHVANMIADQLKNGLSIMDSYLFPTMAKEGGSLAKGRLFYRVIILTLIFGLVAFLSTVIIQIVIPVFFSEKYVKSIPFARLLILSLVISCPGSVVMIYFRAKKLIKGMYLVKIFKVASFLISLLVLIPEYKVMGIIWATIICDSVYTLAALYLAFRS